MYAKSSNGISEAYSTTELWNFFSKIEGIDPYNYPSGELKGDVNDDGKVDVSDAVELISKCVSGTTGKLDPEVCDIDGNGSINMTDALMIVDLYIKR